jgi:Holliday junction resolvase RusA-like endonuclease
MTAIKFRYDGEAVGKGRPRVKILRKGDKVFPQLYTPEKTKAFEEALRFEFLAQNCEQTPVFEKDIPLQMSLTIGVAIPKSYPKKKHALCRDRVLAPTGKPDIDNVIKSVADSLNGEAFADDSQLVRIYAERFYSEEPFVEVEIRELR